ncbi:MAG: tetratricopeptide repeat protein [Deltaproteobacteria bacterium]|nr:tetratricopeptide repeat protein [Deltaproteobacteria bacterium]
MIKAYIERGISFLIKENEPLKAILEFKNAYRISPRNFSVLYWMGICYFTMGSLNAAQFFLRKSLAGAKTLEEKCISTSSLAMIYIEKKEFKVAEGFLRAVLRMAFKTHSREMIVIAYTKLAHLNKALKDLTKALFYLKRALALSSGMKRAFILKDMADIYQEMEEYKKAIEFYEDALSIEGLEGNVRLCTNILLNIIYSYKKIGNAGKVLEFSRRTMDYITKHGTEQEINDVEQVVRRAEKEIASSIWFSLTQYFSNR